MQLEFRLVSSSLLHTALKERERQHTVKLKICSHSQKPTQPALSVGFDRLMVG